MDEDKAYIGAEEYQSYKQENKLTFKQIMLRHYQNITDIYRNKEKKEEYIDAVDVLYDLSSSIFTLP